MLTVGLALYNQLDRTKAAWGCLLGSVPEADRRLVRLAVVDNGSQDGTLDWVRRFVAPHFGCFAWTRWPENRGVFAACNELGRLCETSILAILHNDLHVYEYGWNRRVARAFEEIPRLGVLGFAGARGVSANGQRFEFWSNLLEAELHGSRGSGLLPVAMLDGLALVCSTQMLRDVGGFDEAYPFHHFYDLDICMASMACGYRNVMLGVSCHHESGITAAGPDYETWVAAKLNVAAGEGDRIAHRQSTDRFLHKWKNRLPVFVPDDLNRRDP